jgi:hypothetical protein
MDAQGPENKQMNTQGSKTRWTRKARNKSRVLKRKLQQKQDNQTKSHSSATLSTSFPTSSSKVRKDQSQKNQVDHLDTQGLL